jgi:nicotinamidase-related amidase
MGPDIKTSALIVVDMVNDFLRDGAYIDRVRKEHPDVPIDLEFLASTIPNIERLEAGFREADRPVIHMKQLLEPDYADACFPYWRFPDEPGALKSQFAVRGTWGAETAEEVAPKAGEKMILKNGYDGFYRTALETILRNLGVTTCVMTGVTTAVCVSATTRGGVERNFRMIVVSDATAEIRREWHEAELAVLEWAYADIRTTEQVVDMLAEV